MAGAPSNEPSASEVFDGLKAFQNLQRERALAHLKRAIAASRIPADEVEPLALVALKSEQWEARHGGLLAAAEMIAAWDRPDFRDKILEAIPELLKDSEYRVRKAIGNVLLECSKREGLAIYDRVSPAVLKDIEATFHRKSQEPEVQEGETVPPPSFLPDTTGWQTLETSMGALEAMMQGCGAAFTPRIDDVLLELLRRCSQHTNRFVREYAYFSLKNVIQVCEAGDRFLTSVAPQVVTLVAAGIKDNWSQVRYAASVAVRAFVEKAGSKKSDFFPMLLGPMCLNRHYVAEGVKLYSQETWRMMCGPAGGASLLMAHFDSVIDAYVDSVRAPNHAVREAGCHCIAELAVKIAGLPSKPGPHRIAFTHPRVQRLLIALRQAFEDESWPVRDVASTALGCFVRAFPIDCEVHKEELLEHWLDQLGDNIPSMRRNGGAAFAMAAATWDEEWWPQILEAMRETLPLVATQTSESKVFTDYTPSGPFSVPKAKPKALDDAEIDVAHTNQPMYSCGSLAPKTLKRDKERRRAAAQAGGCMNCAEKRAHQPWEASEGHAHLLTDMAKLARSSAAWHMEDRLAEVASLLPLLRDAFECSQYAHQHLYKQRVCERLPELTAALGPEHLHTSLPGLLQLVSSAAQQDAHGALQACAQEVLVCWRKAFTAEELQKASKDEKLPVS